MQINQSIFLITGAASGLGLAASKLLAAKGARLMLVDRGHAALEALARELGPDKCMSTVCDVLNSNAIEQAIAAGVQKWGTLNGAVNCAGIAPPQKVVSKELTPLPLEDFKAVIDVNLLGTFNVIRLAAAAMARLPRQSPTSDHGVIINTASVAAFEGQIDQAAYSASKGAVAAMALPIARELARYGVRVMTIAPGIFETPMLAGLPEKARESLGTQVPCPARLGKPEEYAKLCVHIIENEYLNGEVIRLDGAIRMGAK